MRAGGEWLIPFLIILVGGSLVIFDDGPNNWQRESRRSRNYQRLDSRTGIQKRVEAIADSLYDKDGVPNRKTSPDEWAPVYRELGVHFDELHPKELTVRQLETYLADRTNYIPSWKR